MKLEEAKEEKRKELETALEKSLRRLETQAASLGLSSAELVDLRGLEAASKRTNAGDA